MRHTRRWGLIPLQGMAVLLIAAWTAGPVHAQPVGVRPVEELRQALRSATDPAERDRRLDESVAALRGIGDLRAALALREWQDESLAAQVSAVDRVHRATVARRLETALREMIAQGDPAIRLAHVNLIAAMGVTDRGAQDGHNFTRAFGPDLAELVRRDSAPVRETAAPALGLINPDPGVAVPALQRLLQGGDVPGRRAAAEGLVGLVVTSSRLAAVVSSSAREGRQARRDSLVRTACAVISAAGAALQDPCPQVRQLAARAIGEAAAALRELNLSAGEPGGTAPAGRPEEIERERSRLLPLVLALGSQRPLLAAALNDADPGVRLQVCRVLAEMAVAPRQGEILPVAFVPGGQGPADVYATLTALSARLKDPVESGRLAAVEALEALGPAAVPAAPALVMALDDTSPFVRWAAARTLRKLGPVEPGLAVPALTRLLHDRDADLCLAAARALENYGAAARLAVPGLVRLLTAGDAELCLASLRVLARVGPEAQPAVPALAVLLHDPNPRIRREAARLLAALGPLARGALDALQQVLHDPDADVQEAVCEALWRITAPR